MIADGRVGAWVASWQHLEVAGNLIKQLENRKSDDPVHGLVGALMESYVARAVVYASLATVTKTVGLGAGDWMVQEQERKAEHERMMTKIRDTMAEKNSDG